MGAATVSATPLAFQHAPGMKTALITVTLSNSYATGGDSINLGTGGNLSTAHGFTKVFGVSLAGHETAASDKYYITFIPGASNSPTAGLLKIRDLSAASDAEVSNATDLSATVVRLRVSGL
jgi:hypothetical protein